MSWNIYVSINIYSFISIYTYITYIVIIIHYCVSSCHLFWFLFKGHKVIVRFGCEIIFDDLIDEHERIYGKLWKYKSNNRVSNDSDCRNIVDDNDIDNDNDHNHWISKPNDYILYSKITLRIERELMKLIQQHQNDR